MALKGLYAIRGQIAMLPDNENNHDGALEVDRALETYRFLDTLFRSATGVIWKRVLDGPKESFVSCRVLHHDHYRYNDVKVVFS